MFANKVVLITGASSGIGADTAVEFSKLEAKLVLTGRNKENLEKTAQKCEDVSPRKLRPVSVVADIVNERDVEELLKETINHFGQLDVLVNNAGIMGLGSIEGRCRHGEGTQSIVSSGEYVGSQILSLYRRG